MAINSGKVSRVIRLRIWRCPRCGRNLYLNQDGGYGNLLICNNPECKYKGIRFVYENKETSLWDLMMSFNRNFLRDFKRGQYDEGDDD